MDQSRSGSQQVDKQTVRRVVSSSFIGTTLEYYEFFIYAAASALVFNKIFFPSFSPVVGVLASFATFAVGFVARPIGSIVLGSMGDRLGRKRALVLSMVLMGVSTVAIGLLPSYGTIGFLAPLLLVLFRLVQGFALGGEWGGAALMLVENARPERRFSMGSVVNMGTPGGLILSTAVISATVSFTGDNFETWGWRVPFLLSAVLVLAAYYIRSKLEETPEFRQSLSEVKRPVRVPIRAVLRRGWRQVLQIFLICGAANAVYFIVATYTLSYATSELGIPRQEVLYAQLAAAFVYVVAIPAYGRLADKIGPAKVVAIGCGLSALFAFFYFPLISTGNLFLIFIGMTFGLSAVHAAIQAPQAGMFTDKFPVRVRYSGVAFSQALPTAIVGGTSPFIATALFSATGSTTPIAAYMATFAVIGFVTALTWNRTEGKKTMVVEDDSATGRPEAADPAEGSSLPRPAAETLPNSDPATSS
ncbi:MHS family MFS transporter [Rhodococcoides fascians A25f]|uniref:MFS transporter n=1 Tax=Rhodococcoides fascians TaxID=1828 RepID=UPI000689D2D5|nr:MFS transporter [Rhodococcus fascians]QII07285.1 MHS family MFS transporter [Rhodococcus fascians A25f]